MVIFLQKIQYGLTLGVLLLFLGGCTREADVQALDNIKKIRVFDRQSQILVVEITDRTKIEHILDAIHHSNQGAFSDPEPMGNLYTVVFISDSKQVKYVYNDLLEYGGKLYPDDDQLQKQVRSLHYEFGDLLLGAEN